MLKFVWLLNVWSVFSQQNLRCNFNMESQRQSEMSQNWRNDVSCVLLYTTGLVQVCDQVASNLIGL